MPFCFALSSPAVVCGFRCSRTSQCLGAVRCGRCREVCLPFVVSSSPVFFFSCPGGFRGVFGLCLPRNQYVHNVRIRIWDGQFTNRMDLVKDLFWAIYNDQPAEVTPNGGEK